MKSAAAVHGSPTRPAVALPTWPLLGVCAGALGAAALGGAGVLDATAQGPWPCTLRAVTGLPCPLCGLTRSVAAAGGGDLAASFERHPLGLPALALAAALLAALARGRPVRMPSAALGILAAAVMLTWTLQLVRYAA